MTDKAEPPFDQKAEGSRCAAHQAGLRLLDEAGITGDRVPPSFDGAALVQRIERLKRRLAIAWAAENPTATSEQRQAAGSILRRVKQLATSLRAAANDPNPVVARAFADDDGPLPLHQLIELLDRLSAAKPHVAARLGGLSKATPTTAPAPWPREPGPTLNDDWLGHKLPALYQELFGRPPSFAPTQPSGSGPDRHTECVRFVAVVASRCLDQKITPGAVIKARRRWREHGQSVPAKNASAS